MSSTLISWATHSWNPIVGCTRISKGCDHCYAINEAWRIAHNTKPLIAKAYEGMVFRRPNGVLDWMGTVRLIQSRLKEPLQYGGHRRYFVNSMGDLFHKDVPDVWIDQVIDIITQASGHTFIVLTKRADRLAAYMNRRDYVPENMICGVSIEDQETANRRLPSLLNARIPHRLVSYEPAIGAVDLSENIDPAEAYKIDWIICGGESGKRARPCHMTWIRSMIQQCRQLGISCFVKQLGDCTVDGSGGDAFPPHWERQISWKARGGKVLDEWPEDFQIQEFPAWMRRN